MRARRKGPSLDSQYANYALVKGGEASTYIDRLIDFDWLMDGLIRQTTLIVLRLRAAGSSKLAPS